MWRTLHTGRVWIMVSTVSSRVAPAFIMVAMILGGQGGQDVGLDPAAQAVGQHHDHVLVRPDDLHLVPRRAPRPFC